VLILLLALGPAPFALAETKDEVHPVSPIALAVSTTGDPGIQPAVHDESISDSARVAVPLAQASTYTYTISLPGDTYVTMGDHSTTLAFTLTNGAPSAANIDQVTIGLPASVYWVSTATNAPAGWQITQIKNAGGGQAWVQFDALSAADALEPGESIVFSIIAVGNQFGVIPSADRDSTDILAFVTVIGEGMTFTQSGPMPEWYRKSLAVSLLASPGSLAVDSLVGLTMDVFNRSTFTQTAIVPVTMTVSGNTSVTLASGPAPISLTIPPGESAAFTWTYTATSSGEVSFGNLASNGAASSTAGESNTVLVGDFTAALELEPTQIISGQLATVIMTIKNNADSTITDVVPSDLGLLGTVTATLLSSPSAGEDAVGPGEIASFAWVYTITGGIGATYRFTGTASTGSGIVSNVATSPQGVVKKYTTSVVPRYAPIGTLTQTLEFIVANNGGAEVEFVEFTLPSGFVYASGNADGGYEEPWTVVADGTGNPRVIQFQAPVLPTDTVPVGAMATFSITFSALPSAAASYAFPVRIRDTTGVQETVEAIVTITQYDLDISATPSEGIYADGVSTSTITATVAFSGTGESGKTVQFHTTKGILSSDTGTTDASGVATVTLTAPQSFVDTSALVVASYGGVQDEVVVSFLGSYLLTTNTVGEGAISRDPDQSGYRYGDVVTLTATADAGWTFDAWSGDASGTGISTTVTITGNMSVTATFTQANYTLTVNLDGNGTVDADPDQTTYVYGDVVTLTATADPGWTFSAWSGDASGTGISTTVSITGNMAVTATFTQDDYTLIVNTDGNGTVEANPDQTTYVYGDVVTLTAIADPGWTFGAWSGDASGTALSTTVTITGDMSVTATFTQDDYTLTLNADGNGTVDADPDQTTYIYGDVVTLTAIANPGWTFDAWSGDASGTALSTTVTITGNMAVTATFTQDGYSLDVDTVGNGSVGMDPVQGSYAYNQVVTLTATADPGWTFASWSGDASGSDNPLQITIQGDTLITATFTQNAYALTVNISGNGTVVADPDQPSYAYGDVVTLTATADPGWAFDGWSGDASGSDNPLQVTIVDDTTITATFVESGPLPPVKLTIGPDMASVEVGSGIAFTATAENALGETWDVTSETAFQIETGAAGYWIGNLYETGNVGTWTVTGEYAGLTDTTELTVSLAKIYLPIVLRSYP